ncbi:MAG TPA: MFS transporter [Paludibacter sp.]|nr:MFS transporter [Paludibacter sp.]
MNNKIKSPWTWVPTLYFAEGLPYVAVMVMASIMYKLMGLENDAITLYIAWLGVPWIIKPLWSPFVDIVRTKRWWILTMQVIIGSCFAGIAFTIPAAFYLQASLVLLFLLAFSSATHDIACDGFYMLGLPTDRQAFFVGIRNTAYRLAVISGSGLLVMLGGYWAKRTGNLHLAWSWIFYIMSALFLLLFLYHRIFLPKPASDELTENTSFKFILKELGESIASFFRKKNIIPTLLFILLYRFSENQLNVLSKLFMLDPASKGGLGLTAEEVGLLQGTVGVVSMLLGGVIGGMAIARNGLKFWLWPMAIALSIPHLAYVYLSYFLPQDFLTINICVAIEQFGFGFGFTAFMVYLMYFAEGKYKTSHYAISTGFMALGVSLANWIAGMLEKQLGYQHFFIWVLVCSLFTFGTVAIIKVDKDFGKKTPNPS